MHATNVLASLPILHLWLVRQIGKQATSEKRKLPAVPSTSSRKTAPSSIYDQDATLMNGSAGWVDPLFQRTRTVKRIANETMANAPKCEAHLGNTLDEVVY